MFNFSQGVYPDGIHYTQGTPKITIQTKTRRGEEHRNKTQDNSSTESKMELGLSDRNIRKNVHVTSKKDASLAV